MPDYAATRRDLGAVYRKYYPTLVARAAADLSDSLGVEVTLPPADVARLNKQITARVKGVTDTMRGDIADLVDEYSDDEELLTERLADLLGRSEWQARRIARTETALAYNSGTTMSARSLDVARVYVSDGDGDEECAAVNGTYQTLDWAEENPLEHPNCVRQFTVDPGDLPDSGDGELEQKWRRLLAKHNRPGDHPMGGYNPDWRREVVRLQQPRIEERAIAHNMTTVEYETAVAEHLRGLLDQCSLQIRRSPETLLKILNEGRFKTQHETKTSGGLLDPNFRTQVEQEMMNQPPDQPLEQRTVYGYVSPVVQGFADAYGTAAIELDPALRDRTTITFGDSIDESAPNGLDLPLMCPQSLINPSVQAVRVDLYDPLDAATPLAATHLTTSYIEAQIHGGVQASDIRKVVLTWASVDTPDPALLARLDELKIPYEVRKRG